MFQFLQRPISLNTPANPFGHRQLSEPGCPWDRCELFTSSFTIHPGLWKHPRTCSVWYHPSSLPAALCSLWLCWPWGGQECSAAQGQQHPALQRLPNLPGTCPNLGSDRRDTLRALRGSWGRLGPRAGLSPKSCSAAERGSCPAEGLGMLRGRIPFMEGSAEL